TSWACDLDLLVGRNESFSSLDRLKENYKELQAAVRERFNEKSGWSPVGNDHWDSTQVTVELTDIDGKDVIGVHYSAAPFYVEVYFGKVLRVWIEDPDSRLSSVMAEIQTKSGAKQLVNLSMSSPVRIQKTVQP